MTETQAVTIQHAKKSRYLTDLENKTELEMYHHMEVPLMGSHENSSLPLQNYHQ